MRHPTGCQALEFEASRGQVYDFEVSGFRFRGFEVFGL